MKTSLILFLFITTSAWGQIFYQPLVSAERNEISGSISINIKDWDEEWSKNISILSFKYALYFPEIKQVLPDNYANLFLAGLTGGVHFFKHETVEKEYAVCKYDQNISSSIYHLGLKGKITYFPFFQPFAEGGIARGLCHSNNFSKIQTPQKKLAYYFSYGLFLSFGILDRTSIYALDQDYGVNDVGIRTECLHYHTKDKNEAFNFCQIGLQLAF